MSITSSLSLSIITSDGQATMTKSVTGLSFVGVNEMYAQPLVVGVAPPAQPTATPDTGGSMTAGAYLVKISYVNAPQGESLPSPESASATVASSGKLTIKSPAASSPATGYNVYITAAGGGTGTETKQNSTPVPIGTDYVQTAAVSAGAALPSSNSTLTFSATLPQIPVQLAYLRNTAVTLATPSAPSLSQLAGGTLSATTYYAKITLVSALGETLASDERSLSVSANNLLQISSPAAIAGASGYNVYVSSTTGTETLQNASPIAFGAAWLLPTSGLISGSALPTANSTGRVATVSWTPQGGSSEKVLDLVSQAAIVFLEPTAGANLGGVTAISIAVSDVQTPLEAFFAG